MEARRRSWADEVDEELGPVEMGSWFAPRTTTVLPMEGGDVADTLGGEESMETVSEFGDTEVYGDGEEEVHDPEIVDQGNADEENVDDGDDEWAEADGEVDYGGEESEYPETFSGEATTEAKWLGGREVDDEEIPRGRLTREEELRNNVLYYLGDRAVQNGALIPFAGSQNARGGETDIWRHDFRRLNNLEQPKRDRSISSIRVPSPIGESPARIDWLEKEKHRLTAELRDANADWERLSADYNPLSADYQTLEADKKYAREEMDRAFKKAKEKVIECAELTKDRDTWKEQFGKAKPYILAGKERERAMREDMRQVGTQTEVDVRDAGMQTGSRDDGKSADDKQDVGTQTERQGDQSSAIEMRNARTQTESKDGQQPARAMQDAGTQIGEQTEEQNEEQNEEPETSPVDEHLQVWEEVEQQISLLKARADKADELAKRNQELEQEKILLQQALDSKNIEPAKPAPEPSPRSRAQSIKQEYDLSQETHRLRQKLNEHRETISMLRTSQATLRDSVKHLSETNTAKAGELGALRSIGSAVTGQVYLPPRHTNMTSRAQRDADASAATVGHADLVVILPAAGELVSFIWRFLLCLILLFMLLEALPIPLNNLWLNLDSLMME